MKGLDEKSEDQQSDNLSWEEHERLYKISWQSIP